MRISEFAKTLGKESKEVIAILMENGIEKKAMSNITDDEMAMVTKKLGASKETKAEAVKEETAASKPEDKKENKKQDVKEEAEKTEEADKPKKKISAVFNPQNSSGKRFGNRNEGRQIIGHRDNGENTQNRQGERNNEGKSAAQPQKKTPFDMKKAFDKALGTEEKKQAPVETPKQEEVKKTETPKEDSRPLFQQKERVFVNFKENREYVNLNQDKGRNNRDNRGDKNGYNRGGDNRGDRNNNRDGRGGDNRGDRNGFNRDNRGGDNRNGGFNRDNRGDNRNGFNRDNRNGGFNRDNRGGFDKDKYEDNESRRGGQGGGRNDQRRSQSSAPDIRMEQKSEGRNMNKNQYGNKKDKSRDHVEDQENLKLKRSDINKKKEEEKKEEEIKVITIPETLTIKDLADKLKMQPSALVKKLFMQGKIVTINQEIDFETAEEIALEFDIISEKEVKVDQIEELLKEEEEDPATLKSRPPVVCVMGHVDHGKTSLLDAIRETNVTSHEHGGITQHIGAYTVEKNGQVITFLDTPGHEAFTAMRMRGAQSTDIAILVVAADDGVMPQTVEAINHAKAAGIHIIVAINKIDKPSANIDKVKQELSEYELIPEDWGGTTIFVPVSAHTKEGIDELLEMVLLDAEMCELKANPDRRARGLVLEAKLDKGKGSVANILVQKGTLHVGDAIAAGEAFGKVRAMIDDKGRRIKSAGPSTPVEILGLNGVPNAGETFVVTENEKEARNFASVFVADSKEKLIEGTKAKLSLDSLFSQIQAGEMKELEIVVKADVQGSVEAMKQSLLKLSNDEVVVKIIHSGVGAINESDVILASASNAIIIGFNVKPDNQARDVAEREKVDLRLYSVIYNAIEDVEAAMKGLLDPVYEEKVIGHAEIRQIFKASGVGHIAGSYILDGLFKRDCKARITREGELIFEGSVASLKRFKDDVKEVKAGFECGLVFEGFHDIKEFDQVEAYEMVEVPR